MNGYFSLVSAQGPYGAIDFLPILAACIPAGAALLVLWITLNSTRRRNEVACARAVCAEMRQISKSINDAQMAERGREYASVDYFLRREAVGPIYRGSAGGLGLLQPELVEKIIESYTSMLAIQHIRALEPERAYMKSDLVAIVHLVDSSVAQINAHYKFNSL